MCAALSECFTFIRLTLCIFTVQYSNVIANFIYIRVEALDAANF